MPSAVASPGPDRKTSLLRTYLAAGRLNDVGQDSDPRRLARAAIADECDNLAGVDVEVVTEAGDRAEPLGSFADSERLR